MLLNFYRHPFWLDHTYHAHIEYIYKIREARGNVLNSVKC